MYMHACVHTITYTYMLHTHTHTQSTSTQKTWPPYVHACMCIYNHMHIYAPHIHTHTQSTSTQKLCVRDRIDDSAILSTCSSCRGSRVGFPAHTSSTASVLGMPTSSGLCGHLHACCTQTDKQANIQTYK